MTVAGTVEHNSRRYRVKTDFEALARLAAAASADLQGDAGRAEVWRFFHHVIDRRDYNRYARSVARTDQDVVLGAKCIAVILAYAAASPDPELSQWAADFRQAIVEFRAGETEAFTNLARRNALAVGVLLDA